MPTILIYIFSLPQLYNYIPNIIITDKNMIKFVFKLKLDINSEMVYWKDNHIFNVYFHAILNFLSYIFFYISLSYHNNLWVPRKNSTIHQPRILIEKAILLTIQLLIFTYNLLRSCLPQKRPEEVLWKESPVPRIDYPFPWIKVKTTFQITRG